jgi:hypothetical protein
MDTTAEDPEIAGTPKQTMNSLINISQMKGLPNVCLCSMKKVTVLATIRYCSARLNTTA